MNKAWLSGFFDGEGCVSLYRDPRSPNSFALTVHFTQRDVTVLHAIKTEYPESRLMHCWIWELKFIGKNSRRILNDIQEFSRVKRPQIDLALQFLETKDFQKRMELAARIKSLKRPSSQ
jgi:hypothetical protein